MRSGGELRSTLSESLRHWDEEEPVVRPDDDANDPEQRFWDAMSAAAFQASQAAWEAVLRQELEVLVEYCTAPRTSDSDPGAVAGTTSADSKRVHVPTRRRSRPCRALPARMRTAAPPHPPAVSLPHARAAVHAVRGWRGA
jgi:hypothetical protein